MKQGTLYMTKVSERYSLEAIKARADAAARSGAFVWTAPHVEADLSRQALDGDDVSALMAKAKAQGLPEAIKTLFAGEVINGSENRPALHWALRGSQRGKSARVGV